MIAFSSVALLAPAGARAFGITIDIAPNVLDMPSQGAVVTVHTDIAHEAVIGPTVFLDGVAISHWKADDRGNFVARFQSDEVKTLDGLVIGDYNLLVLTGYDVNGEAFIGSRDILVIDVKAQKKK